MLRKILGIASCVGAGALSISACTPRDLVDYSSDAGPKFDSGAKRDSGAAIVPDTGLRECQSGGCVDVTASSGYDTATAKVAAIPGACTDAMIAGGAASCLGSDATQETCNAFFAAHEACAACLFVGTKDAAGKTALPAVLPVGDSDLRLNTEACFAVALGNEAACGMAYVNEAACLQSTCSTCTELERSSCVGVAAGCSCESAVVDPDGTCGKALVAASDRLDEKCRSTTLLEGLSKVAAVLCK